jgi:hypothetical protein
MIGRPRMARSQVGSLFLTCVISSITAPRRFIPTLSLCSCQILIRPLFVIMSLCPVPVGAQTGDALLLAERGVVVEAVSKGSEAENAGAQAGDVILAWSWGTAEGLMSRHLTGPRS